MILAVDVNYSEIRATVAGVLFADWHDENPSREVVSFMEVPADYQPGQFYKRELPCILKLIEENELSPECIVVDGFVYLDGYSKPGLGKYLFDALGGRTPVIGVAKSRFKDIGAEYELYRGASNRPLYVTAEGIELDRAKAYIRSMHGKYRQPTLLKRVDQLCRVNQGPDL
jgi:deoxyribonuclease V